MHTRGAIFFHPLNTPSKDEPYLFVKTTSQQKDKPLIPGCIEERSLFFIPVSKSFFKENTWIELYERYPMRLDSKTLDKIIDCLFAAEDDDIPPIHRKLLRPALHESILKLKEKFDSGK